MRAIPIDPTIESGADGRALRSPMKIVYITAGAAGMYCGSCMRDNTLAAALKAKGRDVLLAPAYTPIRTDEPDVSERRVLYGGINVYLQQASAVFRHTPWIVDRLFDSRKLLGGLSRWAGSTPPEDLGKLTVSMLEGRRGAQHKELRKLIRWLERIRPDLVNLPNAMFVGLAGPIKESLGIPVLCTLTGEDIFLDKLPDPFRTRAVELIRARGRDVDGFVAVSAYYASYSREHFGIDPDRMHVIPLGVHVEYDLGIAPPPQERFTIGYLARICPEKGLYALCEAFGILRSVGRSCRLIAAGYLGGTDEAYLAETTQRMADRGIEFDYIGELDRAGKLAFLRSLDVLSVPTTYPEPKGLYVLEALACGVPVVQPGHGAFPELIEATGGGLLCEPHDSQALADGIARLMDDADLRKQLGRQGQAAVRESFTDDVMADRTWSLYERICADREPARAGG